jgi:hypothetical protein
MPDVMETIECEGLPFEVVEMPEMILAGKLAYATDLAEEPDIAGLDAARRAERTFERVVAPIDAGCTWAVSIDCWRGNPEATLWGQTTV